MHGRFAVADSQPTAAGMSAWAAAARSRIAPRARRVTPAPGLSEPTRAAGALAGCETQNSAWQGSESGWRGHAATCLCALGVCVWIAYLACRGVR